MSLYKQCSRCGIDEDTCMREQRRAQSSEPCDERREQRAREEREEMVFVYTNAPATYDYWYTVEVNARAGIDTAKKTWRCVRIPSYRVEAQSARYRSGYCSAVEPRYWHKAIAEGIITVR